jgi:transcription initiation factor IIE alpha subunit
VKYKSNHYTCKCGNGFTVSSDFNFKAECPRCGKIVKEADSEEKQIEEHSSNISSTISGTDEI